MNARGHDLYVRPAGPTGLLLLDGLSKSAVAKLEGSPLPPCVKVQTDENSYQAWIRLADHPVSADVRTQLLKKLGMYKATLPEFGLMAGFIQHRSGADGKQGRFVIAHHLPKVDHAILGPGGSRGPDELEKIAREQSRVSMKRLGPSRGPSR